MSEQDLRKQLYSEIKNRAMIYHHVFSELRNELGEEKAKKILGRAIYRRGLEMAGGLIQYAPADMDGIKQAIFTSPMDEGQMFQAEVLRCDSAGLDLKCHRCPLVEAWKEADLTDSETANLCQMAAQVDYGIFEGAGVEFSVETWEPGKMGVCIMHIRPRKGGNQ